MTIKATERIISILIILFFQIGHTQSKISGTLKEESQKPIVTASIVLKDATDKIIEFTHTDANGFFNLKTQKTGTFTLVASALGFEQKNVALLLENQTESKTLHLVLTSKETVIKEVIIETKRPITVKGDSIIFNAASFKQGNELVVEDLLKKIPGLNIDANGTIKVGNQEVEKVMVDGDDIFEKGYKLLTKNMPVDPIDKVELYQNYSNNKHLKGIENSNKVALNLTLKEDAKRVWFGNFSTGYGLFSENRYAVKANLMNFGKKNKYYFLTSMNNIGEDATGDINHLIRPYRYDEPASIGDNQNAIKLLELSFVTPNLRDTRVRFNNTEMLSLNSIYTLSKKMKLKTLGFLNSDELNYYRNHFQTFSFGTNTFSNTEIFTGKKMQITGFGKLDFTYDISKNKTLEFTSKFNVANEKSRSDLWFNNELLNERLRANNQLIDQKIVFTNKFKETKVWLLSGRYVSEKTPQNYSVNQFIFNDLFSDAATDIKQFSKNKMQFAGIEAHWLDKRKNGDLLEIKIGNQFRSDVLQSQFQLLQDETSIAFPSKYQNQLTYSTNDFYVLAKYLFKYKNLKLLTQAEAHQLNNTLESINLKWNKNPIYILPKIGLTWKINKLNSLVSYYDYSVTNTSITDVFSGYILTNFRSFSKGLEQFNQLHASNVVLNHTYGSFSDKYFSNTMLIYSKNHDFYSTSSLIASSYSQSEKIIIKDRQLINLSSNLERFFKPIKSNIRINLGAAKSNFKNIVNNSDLREVTMLNANYGLELRSGFRGCFNYHVGSKWNYNEVTTTSVNSFTDNTTFLDLSLVFNDTFNVQLQTERYHFGNLDSNNKYYFLDLETRYKVKNKKLIFSLSGNNLFNTKTYRNYSITDISISKTEYRLQPRYLLLKMEFRF